MADLNAIVEQLSGLTLLEAADLKKMLEEKWGVTAAAAPVMMAGGGCRCGCRRAGGREDRVRRGVRRHWPQED